MEDQFEESTLAPGDIPPSYRLLGAFYRNARAQFHYRLGETLNVFSYWTRSGARVPLCFSTKQGTLGFIPLPPGQHKPTLSQSRASDSFLRAHPEGKVIYLASTPLKAEILDSRVLVCSAAALI